MAIMRGLFIFRRDLRLEDNTALNAALNECDEVVCAFIFTPVQLDTNAYRGDHAVEFMVESLRELNEVLKQHGSGLACVYDHPASALSTLVSEYGIDRVYVNKDYTPFAIKRDKAMEKTCDTLDVSWHAYDDYLLTTPGSVLKDDGNPYTVFTPFFRKAKLVKVEQPFTQKGKFAQTHHPLDKVEPKYKKAELLTKGGRKSALALLKHTSDAKFYVNNRNFPGVKATSYLSAHHKFGTLSIRETLYHLIDHYGPDHIMVSELYWRDFFTHIAWHFPHVFGNAFRKKYDAVEWDANELNFVRWCKGNTGFPIVDAGMRELNTTGFMHNRVRMIVASFLTKDLHIDWRWGEKYFAQQLIDYDPSVNNGNWQWAASTGCDAQPYFRIFNPWSQQQKFDPDCVYIKKWVFELRDASTKDIHDPNVEIEGYAFPMVDHGVERDETLARFKSL